AGCLRESVGAKRFADHVAPPSRLRARPEATAYTIEGLLGATARAPTFADRMPWSIGVHSATGGSAAKIPFRPDAQTPPDVRPVSHEAVGSGAPGDHDSPQSSLT